MIAQDIYYDCPESRHLIYLPSDATPAQEKPTGGDDPQQDPDYDGAGWGTESASVSYTQIIPVLVKSNQELHERIVDLESAQVMYDAQIADLEAAVASREQQIDELRSELSVRYRRRLRSPTCAVVIWIVLWVVATGWLFFCGRCVAGKGDKMA